MVGRRPLPHLPHKATVCHCSVAVRVLHDIVLTQRAVYPTPINRVSAKERMPGATWPGFVRRHSVRYALATWRERLIEAANSLGVGVIAKSHAAMGPRVFVSGTSRLTGWRPY